MSELDYSKIHKVREKLSSCRVDEFRSKDDSYYRYVLEINIENFRNLKNVSIRFDHPITVVSGQNKVGKTSILLLLACSHEGFYRLDSSKPEPTWRLHNWRDVIAFTSYETEQADYSYRLNWRVGNKKHEGEGKRLASSKAWSGLGKRATDRMNAKIRDREVRLIDLERILPARSFSSSLLRKVAKGEIVDLESEIAAAYCYIFEIPWQGTLRISEVAGHVNKRCYLISGAGRVYSSFNAASGEESLINLIRDVFEAPEGSLVLIDEIEVGLHPSVQRRVADVLSMISWYHKKQFVITTHSPTVLASFPPVSRKFIERVDGGLRVVPRLAPETAMSKMDSEGHPLIHLYCEDELVKFLINKILIKISDEYPHFNRLFDIVLSGGATDVRADLIRHKNKFRQVKNRHGYAAIFDGDMYDNSDFRNLKNEEFVHFLYPRKAPEIFLLESYLNLQPHDGLDTVLEHSNPHEFFQRMVDYGRASDKSDARSICFDSFEQTEEFVEFRRGLREFLLHVAKRFSAPDFDVT